MGKRIVINVDGPKAGASPHARIPVARRRRWPRVLAILAGLVVLIIVLAGAGGFVWWRHYQSTPVYTLALIIDAAQRNNPEEFQKRIDDEEIAKNMIADVTQKAAARYGFALNSSIQKRIELVTSTVLPRLRQSINDELIKGINAISSEPRPFVLLLVTIPSLLTVTTEGDTAKASWNLNGRSIELTMQRDQDHWKVTKYSDDLVVQRIVDSVMKELPAIGSIESTSPLVKKPARGRRRR